MITATQSSLGVSQQPGVGPGGIISRPIEPDDDLDFAKKKSMKAVATRKKDEHKKVRSDLLGKRKAKNGSLVPSSAKSADAQTKNAKGAGARPRGRASAKADASK
jgi:hypothetical protein